MWSTSLRENVVLNIWGKPQIQTYRVYSGEFVKKSVKQASIYVSGKLNNVFNTYTRDSSNFKNLFGYSSYTCELNRINME